MPDDRDALQPRAALAEVRAVDARVRSTARRQGWAWVVIGLVTPIFLLVAARGPSPASLWTALGYMAVGLALWYLESRRHLRGRAAARIDRPATWAYVGTVVTAAAATVLLDPSGTEPWYVGLALLPALPCLAAAWVVLRR